MSIFDYLTIFCALLGLGLCALLLSCHREPMRLAQYVMVAPISFRSVTVSLTTVIVAVFSLMSYAYYQQFRQWSVTQTEGIRSGHYHLETERNLYKAERNLFLSLLCLVVWSIAWRLKSISQGAVATLRHHDSILGSFGFSLGRVSWGALLVVSLVAADVPMCRVNYSLQLAAVTQEKQAIAHLASKCEGVFLRDSDDKCKDFCESVEIVSRMRTEAVKGARKYHIMGRKAAEIFDFLRLEKPGEEREQKLFEKKSCADVLKSVDKSNVKVNTICWIAAVVVSMVSVISVTQILGSDKEGAAMNIPEPSAPPLEEKKAK